MTCPHSPQAECLQHSALPRILSYSKTIILLQLKQKSASFKELRALLNTTDGNIASITRTLEKEQLIKIHKKFRNKKSYTKYSLTPIGNFALQEQYQWLTILISKYPKENIK